VKHKKLLDESGGRLQLLKVNVAFLLVPNHSKNACRENFHHGSKLYF